MISKFFDGLIEQLYMGLKTSENNIAMVYYSNDFSVLELSSVKRYSEDDDNVFLSCYEFEYDKITSAYEPFINIICDMHRKYIGGDFGEFLDKCEVYKLQREMLISYYSCGMCIRKEPVLLDEVSYEKLRLRKTMRAMLAEIAKIKPFMLIINRFQKASRSSIGFVRYLTEKPIENFGLILGVNEGEVSLDKGIILWERIREALDKANMVYHIGNTGIRRTPAPEKNQKEDIHEIYRNAVNIYELLDYDTADEYYKKNSYLWYEEYEEDDEFILFKTADMYVSALTLGGNMPKAIELINKISQRRSDKYEHEILFAAARSKARCYSYQGKLDMALREVKLARQEADIIGDELLQFRADLLEIECMMSGWHNVLFVAEDLHIDQDLIGRLMKYGYKNYLAHIYIYSYDNDPKTVALAYRSEAFLKYFSQGIELAKEIDNEVLIFNAYQKNIMIAATNGMNDIALLFDIRTYQSVNDKNSIEGARVLSSIGYNLSALGFRAEAFNYYDRAIELLYELQEAPDIAEVLYNKGINFMAIREYESAEKCFHFVLKIIEKLHMNSIRVCTLSKLYALMALVSILQNKRINCERYLINCKQFLMYVMEKEETRENMEVLHDYAMTDDDQYLYNFAAAYKAYVEGDYEQALERYKKANKYFMIAEGNQYYTVDIFHEQRLELFKKLDRMDLYTSEEILTSKYKQTMLLLKDSTSLDILDEVKIKNITAPCYVNVDMIERLVRELGSEMDYATSKKHISFISQWQKLLDDKEEEVSDIVDHAMKSFLNYFNNDRALYIRCTENGHSVYFNNTELALKESDIELIINGVKEYPEGFVVSKIGDTFAEHLDMISIFGETKIFSFAGIPVYNRKKLEAVFVTYALMVDNWHNSFSRIMFSQDDLNIYNLLFRNLNDGINRIEANRRVKEMNKLLEKNSVTDILTGLYNRFGLYREIKKISEQGNRSNLSVMFIDLDNFKPYNDTYGHDIGDIVLKKMADIFNRAGEGGIVCRYGGDEFIILLRTTDKEELIQRAELIYSMIEEADGFRSDIQALLGKRLNKKACNIGCSIGIATTEQIESDEIDDLIKLADDMLYSIKLKNKGTYAFL